MMAGVTSGKQPHRSTHPVLPSYPNRFLGASTMGGMPSYYPEQWQPSGEADRIVPEREIFRKLNTKRPLTPDAYSVQLARSFPVAIEDKHGRAEWVHPSGNPNLIARGAGEDWGRGGFSGLTKKRLRELKHKLQAAAYGRGDIEDSDDDWEELFESYDQDGSGCLEFDEFRQVIRKHGRVSVRDINDIELNQIFKAVDADNSGEIDGREFMNWLQAPVLDDEPADALPKMKASSDAKTGTSIRLSNSLAMRRSLSSTRGSRSLVQLEKPATRLVGYQKAPPKFSDVDRCGSHA